MTLVGGHYRTLGVPPDASTAEIRAAYRALARRHHPDRSPADAGAMATINEAYRVLSEPARRAVYDATLRGTGSAASAAAPSPVAGRSPSPAGPPPQLPEARYPWKLVVFMFLVGAAIVLLGAALYRPRDPAPPDNLLEAGSCVTIEINRDAREINCTGAPGELVVTALVDMDARCPEGAAGYRDRQGRGLACVTTSSLP